MGKRGIINRSLPFLIIAAVTIIAFHPVAFLQETLKYDILDGYLPGHYFLSECLRNNTFPLWNPYQQLGYPLHADMLNTNYIVDMFIGRLVPYTNITFHILFILYVIIAGTGAFKLANHTGISRNFSLLAGIAYSLSGFITGNAQHIQFITGAAWLPFSVLYFIRMCKQPGLKSTLLFVVFTYLLITGGYPSFAIMISYGLFPVFVHFLIRHIKNRDGRQAFHHVSFAALAFVLIIILCAGMLISIRQATPYVERYVKLTYDYSITNPFPPSALISILAPFVTAVHSEIFPTDISMNNHYFGVITLILFIYSITLKFSKKGIVLLTAAVILLIFSFGEHAFLHRIFFEHVPLFNKFRHPSSFRFITILLLLLFTGIQISRFNPADNRYFQRFRLIYLICISAIAVICGVSALLILYKLSGPTAFILKWDNFIHDFGVLGPLLIQTFIFLVINIPFIYLLLFLKKLNLFYPIITAILIIETVVFTGLNIRYTVTSHYDPLDVRAFLRNSPSGFPLPDKLPVCMHTDESVSHVPLIHNTNTYNKAVSADYMYPFVLDGFKNLRSDSTILKEVINHKTLYFEDYAQGDTIICTELSAHRMAFSIKAGGHRKAVLLQNYYPGWNVIIDGNKAEHYTTHGTLIGINIPKGNHELTFIYRNGTYVKATLASFGLFVLILLIIQTLALRSNMRYSGRSIFFISLIVIGIILCLKPAGSYAETNRQNTENLQNVIKKYLKDDRALFVMNVESIGPYIQLLSGISFIHTRFRNNNDMKEFWSLIDTADINSVVYIWNNVTEPQGLKPIISLRFPVVDILYAEKKVMVAKFSKDPGQGTGRDVHYNSYEMPSPFFSEGAVIDSTFAFSGLYSEILSDEKLFSSTFRKELDGNAANVLAMVRFSISGSNSAHLILSIERRGKSIYYDAVDLREFGTNNDEWSTAFIARNFLKSTLEKYDKLVVYCWNSGNNEAVYLDDFYVQLQPKYPE